MVSDESVTAGGLVSFHRRHKLLLMAHSPVRLRALGRLAAAAHGPHADEVAERYAAEFAATLDEPVSRGRHVNVLQHMAGYLRDRASIDERRAVADVIAAYAAGHVELRRPVTVIREYAIAYGIDYLREQVYFDVHAS